MAVLRSLFRAGNAPEMPSAPRLAATPRAHPRLGARDILLFASWCGLAGGLLEVAVRVLCRSIDPVNRLYMMTRHFIWLAPLSNLLLFFLAGSLLALATWLWPRTWGWLSPRLLCFGALLPGLALVSPQIYTLAWALLALGVAAQLVPVIERHAAPLRRRFLPGFSCLTGLVLALAASLFGRDKLREWREAGRPVPPANTPNVLLIVLDTVRADHLSLYGYERPTSPTLERLSSRGILFENARATAPWTLASHASFFTGRWPHELAVNWMTPIRGNAPTLAEFFGAHGYATAGFVGNRLFCSYDTGLDRGFTHYEDYVLGPLSPWRTAWLVDRTLKGLSDLSLFLSRSLAADLFRPLQESLFEPLFQMDRKKDAASINRAFLDWMSRRRQPGRPFFAFLNYIDAHAPYVLPEGAEYRFGKKPESQSDFSLLIEYWSSIDKLLLAPHYRSLARDCYDNCLFYLDAQLGRLFDELGRRGELDRTLLIIASDHGEGLGEHDLFDHGESLYRTEIHVPLLIVPPAGERHRYVVSQPVSLRDLPATIVDLLGLGTASPFPGRSLANTWRLTPASAGPGAVTPVCSELPIANPSNPNQGRSPAARGPLVSLAEGDFVYILNQRDGAEQLFNEREDRRELSNRAGLGTMRLLVEQFRNSLKRLSAE
jgi:arylsulfatase A-like enzyme